MSKEILYNALGNRERLSKLLSYPSEIFDSWQYVLIMDQLKELSKTEADIDLTVLTARLQAIDEYKKVEQVIQDIMLAEHTVNFDYLLGNAAQDARCRQVVTAQNEWRNRQITDNEASTRYDEIDRMYVIDDDIHCEMSELAGKDFASIFPENNFIPWRLDAMNEALVGIFQNNFIIIAGEPGVGKTTFVNGEARLGRVLYFNLEMDRAETFGKYLQEETGIHVKRIMANKDLSEKEKQSIERAKKNLGESLNIKMYDRRNDDYSFIMNKLKFELMSGDYDKVIIDNLQRIRNIGEGEAGVANMTGSIKSMARDFKTPIIGLSHLVKSAYTVKARPTLGTIKGGGSYIQDADCVIFIYKWPEEDINGMPTGEEKAVIDCQKDRFGAPGVIRGIEFDIRRGVYVNENRGSFDGYTLPG